LCRDAASQENDAALVHHARDPKEALPLVDKFKEGAPLLPGDYVSTSP
jgi:hypothetical protein